MDSDLNFLAIAGVISPSTARFQAVGAVVRRAIDVGDGVGVAAISVGAATTADLTAFERTGGVALDALILDAGGCWNDMKTLGVIGDEPRSFLDQ
eukprot:s274_g27.t1